jgi:hypothetical protein
MMNKKTHDVMIRDERLYFFDSKCIASISVLRRSLVIFISTSG